MQLHYSLFFHSSGCSLGKYHNAILGILMGNNIKLLVSYHKDRRTTSYFDNSLWLVRSYIGLGP